MDRIVVFECFGEEFPIHREEWLEYHSLWQKVEALDFSQRMKLIENLEV